VRRAEGLIATDIAASTASAPMIHGAWPSAVSIARPTGFSRSNSRSTIQALAANPASAAAVDRNRA
jgi:hypothetical protein